MYGEHFDIPAPDELVFISWFEGGEVFRSGCTFRRGRGRIVYFRPGHETHPTYFDPNVRRVIANAVKLDRRAEGSPTNVRERPTGERAADRRSRATDVACRARSFDRLGRRLVIAAVVRLP